MLGERRPRRDDEEGEEAVDLTRRLGDELAIPLQHLDAVLDVPEHRAGVVGVDRVRLEQERRDHAEVAAAAAHRPEQIGVLLGAWR